MLEASRGAVGGSQPHFVLPDELPPAGVGPAAERPVTQVGAIVGALRGGEPARPRLDEPRFPIRLQHAELLRRLVRRRRRVERAVVVETPARAEERGAELVTARDLPGNAARGALIPVAVAIRV